MASTAERLKAAQARDEEGIEQDKPDSEPLEPPPGATDPEQNPNEPEPEPEPEPAPEPETAGLSAEQALELEKATGAYLRRVEKVFGPGNVPPTCSHCEGLGFDLTGGEGPPEYAPHENYIECDDCHGMGLVKTGSKVQGHDLTACPHCTGRGYLEKLPELSAVPTERPTHGTPAWMGNVQPGQVQ